MDRSRGTLAAVPVAGLFLEIIALGVLALWWRSAAWISQVRRLHPATMESFILTSLPFYGRARQRRAVLGYEHRYNFPGFYEALKEGDETHYPYANLPRWGV